MKFLNDILKIITEYGSSYLKGAGNTLLLALIGTVLGCIIGFAVGTVQATPLPEKGGKRVIMKIVRGILRAYVELFRGTPMIVQAVFMHYGMFYMGLKPAIWFSGILVVSINTGAYMAETVRGGIMSIDQGQFEGAKAIGMTHNQTMINVVLPQALRNIIPQIGNNFIINVKDTAVMSIIAFMDLFSIHKSVVGSNYLYFPSAVLTMAIYLTMTLVSSVLLRWWEDKMAGDANYDIVNTKDTLAQTSGLYRAKKKEAKR